MSSKIRWGRLYDRHFPHRTDATSRHLKVISEGLREKKSPLRKLLLEAGYEPDHMAESMEWTVKMLWEAREQIERLGGHPFKRLTSPPPPGQKQG